ncbi:CHASE4 domain-containing protein [Ensifer adhaerens]|uniref:CHASE4 domain-containing protein n=1 Tax=Ensifer adhaerens TaxID=106592 RepID=UPI00202F0F9B
MVEKALRQAKRDKTVWAIHAACTLVAVLIIASLIYVLDRSVTEADRFGLSAERRLVANELRHQMDAVVQFQAQVSFWDKTYEELATGHVSESFVADELSGWLWEDYGFSWIIFTDPARTVSTALKDGASVPAEVARVPLDEVDDLVDEAKRRYDNALRNNDGTYNLDVTTPDAQSVMPAVPGIHAVDLREIGGRMSVAVVQAVIPETLVVPAGRRDPVLMVAVRPVTPKMTREIAARLGAGLCSAQRAACRQCLCVCRALLRFVLSRGSLGAEIARWVRPRGAVAERHYHGDRRSTADGLRGAAVLDALCRPAAERGAEPAPCQARSPDGADEPQRLRRHAGGGPVAGIDASVHAHLCRPR